MANKESTFLNMTLTLFIISLVSALVLGYIHKITEEPIIQAENKKLKDAISIVVPGADNAEIKTDTIPIHSDFGSGNLELYTLTIDGNIIGSAIKSFSNNGFGGTMSVMVGFDMDGKIINSDVLKHQETPGLGDKTSKKVNPWNNQFIGKDPKNEIIKVKKDGGVIDAITSATVSSRAYCNAIEKAYASFMQYNKKNENVELDTVNTHSNENVSNNINKSNGGGINNE